LIVVRAADAFPGCPPKGSIDDQEDPHLAIQQVLALATSQRDYDETPTPEGPSDLSQKESQCLLWKLEQLAAECDRLFAGDSHVAAADRLIHLRAWCKESGLFLRDNELTAKLHEARARAAGSVPMLDRSMEIEAPAENWAWEGILLRADSNLLVALPKVGKTCLVVAMLAAWYSGRGEFLGQRLIGPCPGVFIFGPDMARGRWLRLLARFGLAENLANGKWKLAGPIKGLYSKSEPIALDEKGLAVIADVAAANPGDLFLFDSYNKLISSLDLHEGSNLLAGPIEALQEVVAPHSITPVVTHHAGHGRQGQGAVAASRGSTALPAAVSQVVALSWLNPENRKADPRVLLSTEGREEGLEILIRQEEADWFLEGNAAEVQHRAEMARREQALNERQADVLDLCREQWREQKKTTAKHVETACKIPDRQARRVLRQVESKGFLQSRSITNTATGVVEFWPTETA